jgi:hypothetical protein
MPIKQRDFNRPTLSSPLPTPAPNAQPVIAQSCIASFFSISYSRGHFELICWSDEERSALPCRDDQKREAKQTSVEEKATIEQNWRL